MRTDATATHLPCPDCGSSDALSKYSDGHSYCFACQSYRKGTGELIEKPENAEYKIYPHRGISAPTFEFYNVWTEFVDGNPSKIGFVYPNKAIKFRLADKKEFFSEGPMNEAGCFGVDKFDPGSKDTIVIVEGEYDALACYEILRGSAAVISVRSASSAKRDCTRDYDYINSFGKIVLALDNDEPGQAASRSISGLFDFSKVYHVRTSRFKDANEYLVEGFADDYAAAIKAAKRYAPDNIISTIAEFRDALKQRHEDLLATYPFQGLQDRLYGMFAGEVICFKGLEGIGKTEIFRAIEHHLLSSTKHNIGILHLEEDNGVTVRALAGYSLGAPTLLPDSNVSDADILAAVSKLGADNGRIHIHSSFDVEDEAAILDNIRFLVSAAGCRFIFLDHISWLATGQTDDDERKKLDRISQRLKLLAKELRFCLIEISHVNDAGQTRGSRNITKVANTVIDLSRDVRSGSNRLYMVIEKARLGGRTGPAGSVIFDGETYRLRDETVEDAIKVPRV